MSWLAWIGIVVLLTATVAVFGITPKGARPVGGTRLMGAARLALLVFLVIAAYLVYRGQLGG